jgi:hypothetical protein
MSDGNEKYDQKILKENYLYQIDIWNKSHNISRERSELYHDFLVSLFTLIDDTYLGKDIVNNSEDIMKHFEWCFNKTISNFEMEKIYFNTKGNHFEYLWFFFYGAYYNSEPEDKRTKILLYFYRLFNINVMKNRNELDAFTDLYKIFEQNLKKSY